MYCNGKKVVDRTFNIEDVQRIVDDGFNPIIARVFAARNTVPQALLNKQLLLKDDLHNATMAGAMIAEFVLQKKIIAVASDYDVDGNNSGSLMAIGLRAMGATVHVLMPNRMIDGYGLNVNMVNDAHRKGVDLILTVDNGIVAFNAISEAKKLGIAVVVTDHHAVDSSWRLPNADYIINPMAERGKVTFGSKNLCGAGVAFYVLSAVNDCVTKLTGEKQFNIWSVIDLVSMATVCDMVKLDENNRKLVDIGLKRINSGKINVGLKALMDVGGTSLDVCTSRTFGFHLGPMINAVGRMDDASLNIDLLTTTDTGRAADIALKVKGFNEERRKKQKEMIETAEDVVGYIEQEYCAIVYDESFAEGIVGLVASRLKDKLDKPCGAFAKSQHGGYKGSFRSIVGVNIRDAIDLVNKKDGTLIKTFGGHQGACGAHIHEGKLDAFKSLLNESISEICDSEAFSPTLFVDGYITDKEINFDLVKTLNEEHWGQGLPSPVFRAKIRASKQKIIKEKHCKLIAKIGVMELDGIIFNRAEVVPDVCEIVFSLEINEWQGVSKIQLNIAGVCEESKALI